MDRTVPRTGSEEIELYIRTYDSLLRSSGEIQIRSLEEAHASMASALHTRAPSPEPDLAALIYSSLRLPACIADVERVLLGQSAEVFRRRGLVEIESWQPVAARARRRRSFYDGQSTLACYIASRSDIDDILPILTALQIEWNKLHRRLAGSQVREFLQAPPEGPEGLAVLARGIAVEPADLESLHEAWGTDFWPLLRAIAARPKRVRVRLLASSLTDYQRATHQWWERIARALPWLAERPVYFVSSNTHSLVNLLSGFALRRQDELLRLLDRPEHAALQAEWRDIEAQNVPASRENFLYYALKKVLATPDGPDLRAARAEAEAACGIRRFPSQHSFDIEAQVVELGRLRPDGLDPRLQRPDLAALAGSQAVLVNIDYPLGLAAYQLLSHVAARTGAVRGVYVMGKAASLNGAVGDLMIPSVVHDEHSQNTYLFRNCFSALDLEACMTFGTILDNQKAVTVRGTFLQNLRYMSVFYREGYTDIEMEAGPYLSAVHEMHRPKRHPNDEVVDLYRAPFDVGILHYASDTPLSKGRNLGAGSLSYYGMDPTYAAGLAILRRVLDQELARLRQPESPAPAWAAA